MRLRLIAGLLLALLLARPLAAQEGANGLTLEAQAGFDGLYKPTAALPVVIRAANSGAPLEGEIRVTTGSLVDGESLTYSAPVSLPTQSDKRVVLYINLPTLVSSLAVQFVSEDEVLAEVRTNQMNQLAADTLLYGVVSSDPGALAYLETNPGRRPDAAAAFLSLDDLPDIPAAWNALDAVILDDVDTSALSAAQREAMRAWVETGGVLAVTGGPGGPKTAAGVADLLPVTVNGTESVEALPVLESFTSIPLTTGGPYLLTSATLQQGELRLQQDGLPLLAAVPLGAGQVFFLALDPKLAPLAGWPGTAQLWGQVADAAPDAAPWSRGIQDGYSAVSAVSVIPGLQLPSVWQLGLFALIYTVIIGPVNYLILRRLDRRELAWVTIPALVLLFSALTYFTSFRTRGDAAVLNQMAVAQGQVGAGSARSQTVIGLYSPRRGTFDLTLPYSSIPFPFAQGFGTLQSRNNLEAIERAADVVLRGVRTDTSELATFIADDYAPLPAITAEATLDAGGGSVTVTVRNEGDQMLEDATLVIGPGQVAIGDLLPGAEQTVTQRISAPLGSTSGSSEPGPAAPIFAGGAVSNPLLDDPSLILGTFDYYNDPAAFPRWQLLQALSGGIDPTTTRLPEPTESVTLAGWMSGAALPVSAGEEPLAQDGVTLYLLSVPVR